MKDNNNTFIRNYPKGKRAKIIPSFPDGLWRNCPKCKTLLYTKDLTNDYFICPSCGYHFPLNLYQRLELLTDHGSFKEVDAELVGGNPLDFPNYTEKIESSRLKTKQKEGFAYGDAKMDGRDIVIGVASFAFMGGSMGSIVGEKVTRALERGAEQNKPVIIVCASGGARMQEGIVSLMQMAKTAAAVEKLRATGQIYITVLTDPTTAGVFASYASMGDVIIAEPGALIGFAGPRVIEQNLRIKLPPGTHTAEFQLAHGMIDMVVNRRELRGTVSNLVTYLSNDKKTKGAK